MAPTVRTPPGRVDPVAVHLLDLLGDRLPEVEVPLVRRVLIRPEAPDSGLDDMRWRRESRLTHRQTDRPGDWGRHIDMQRMSDSSTARLPLTCPSWFSSGPPWAPALSAGDDGDLDQVRGSSDRASMARAASALLDPHPTRVRTVSGGCVRPTRWPRRKRACCLKCFGLVDLCGSARSDPWRPAWCRRQRCPPRDGVSVLDGGRGAPTLKRSMLGCLLLVKGDAASAHWDLNRTKRSAVPPITRPSSSFERNGLAETRWRLRT